MIKRNTTQRKALLEVFSKTEKPLCVKEILESARNQSKSLNQATVYRNLKSLLDEGWLRELKHPTLGPLYEKSKNSHSHHFQCRSCKQLLEFHECGLNNRIIGKKGFLVDSHELFLYGTCPSCKGH